MDNGATGPEHIDNRKGYKIEFVKIDEKIRDRQKNTGYKIELKRSTKKLEFDKKNMRYKIEFKRSTKNNKDRQIKYKIQDRIQEIDKK